MDENWARELFGIRDTQRDLRQRLDALDLRIDQVTRDIGRQETPRPFVEKTMLPVLEKARLEKPAVACKGIPSFDDAPAVKPPPIPKTPTSAPPSSQPSAPKPVAEEEETLEMQVGRVWLVRVGILILLTGLVFLGNFAWTEIIAKVGAPGKLATIMLAGLGVAGLGWWVKRKREELSAYGKVLIGGGIATIYYATYAAHFVEPLRVIDSPLVGGVLLMGLGAAILWLANRLRSQAVAAVTVLLGFYTAGINPIAGFSLFSNLILSVIAIVFLVTRQWWSVSFLSMIGCYAAFGFWSYQNTGLLLPIRMGSGEVFWTALLFPACYWVVFTVATFVARSETFPTGTRPMFLTMNNGGVFAFTAPLVATTYPQELWMFVVLYGAILLGLAWLAARKEASDAAFDGAYLTQGLGLISLGILFKFSGYQLAIILALQSVTLLRLSRHRHGVILQVFSGLSALGATLAAWQAISLENEYATLTGVAVAAILIGAGWLFKQQRGLHGTVSFQYRSAGYVVLGLIVTLANVLYGAPEGTALYWFAGLAALFTVSIYLLRMPEVVGAGQIFAIATVGQWLVAAGDRDLSLMPLLCTVGLLGALMHWWPRQRAIGLDKQTQIGAETLATLGVVVVPLIWTILRYAGTDRLWALMLGSLVMLGYAIATRAWVLAVGSQVVAFFGVGILVLAIGDREPWLVVTGALVLFASQSFFLELCIPRMPSVVREWIRPYGVLLRMVSVLIGLGIMECYVSSEWIFLAFSGVTFVLFMIGIRSEPGEVLVYAVLPALMAGGHFVMRNLLGGEVMPSELVGLGLLLVAQQIGKRSPHGTEVFTPHLQGALIVLGLLGAWLVTGRWVATVQEGFVITTAWSVYALVVFSLGVILRERTYRWIALGVLALAIGRVFLFDVWQFDTVWRIVSFLVLGAVLLALGFLYNRLAGLIRKWM